MGDRIAFTLRLALKNLRRKRVRSMCLLILVAVLSFVLFGASLLITSLQNGLRVTAERMGADLMLVPEGYEAEFTGVLLKSEPSSFYLPADVERKAAQLPGVQQACSQLYLQSLDADCCSVPVQLIAFDLERDFTVNPWLEERYRQELGQGEVLVGSLIEAVAGDTLIFYGQSFRVAARLSETGTGLDASVFMSRPTAEALSHANAALPDLTELSSCVMLRAERGADLQALAGSLKQEIDDVDVLVTEELLGSLNEQLQLLARILYLLIGLLWVVSVLVLLLIFNLTIHERRGEFGLYRALGYSRGQLKSLVLCEGGLISVAGSAAGIAVGALILFPFQELIASALKLPYLNTGAGSIFGFFALSAALSILTVLAVCWIDARKLGKTETFLLMREEL